MPNRSIRIRSSGFKLSLLSVAHFFNDLYASFLPTFVPGIIGRLGLSMAQAGLLNTVVGTVHLFCQPVMGYLSDRTTRSWLITIGPILTCLGATLLPNSPSYGFALLFAALWGLGSASFHPQGNGSVGHVVSRERLTSSLAIFSVAGNVGVTLSPLFAVAMAKSLGLPALPFVATIPVLILACCIFRYMPRFSDDPPSAPAARQGILGALTSVFATIFPIWAVSVARDATSQGVRFFLPIQISANGGDITAVGSILFLMMLASTIAMVIGGKLADRLGKRWTLTLLLAVSSVALFPALMTKGAISIALYLVGVSAANATLPVTAALAQEMAPQSRSMASSIVMGLSWGIANLLTGPLGFVADHFGIQATMTIVASLPLCALPFMVFFSRKGRTSAD
jgi:FSR family fosmidomycin resistance protein-like MFS transporter